ncbi:MAG: vanillate O-demethylase oxidoreductase VanB [Acidobacteria bacterium]|nr:MAG: vanillate O-demethylase oxidoreductase VanB [Acidobacteriota bacterium]
MPDRIEKRILLRAPRERVWRAISDKTEYGEWFKVKFPPGKFTPGEHVTGHILEPGYEHLTLEIWIVDVIPETTLSFRWHPYGIDPNYDYSSEPTTLVTFTLEDADGGTRLTIVETGFDQIPLHRRDEAFRMNTGGWEEQSKRIERYVTANG